MAGWILPNLVSRACTKARKRSSERVGVTTQRRTVLGLLTIFVDVRGVIVCAHATKLTYARVALSKDYTSMIVRVSECVGVIPQTSE